MTPSQTTVAGSLSSSLYTTSPVFAGVFCRGLDQLYSLQLRELSSPGPAGAPGNESLVARVHRAVDQNVHFPGAE
jgi:hypothetical protein